jgi:hypothetical protein
MAFFAQFGNFNTTLVFSGQSSMWHCPGSVESLWDSFFVFDFAWARKHFKLRGLRLISLDLSRDIRSRENSQVSNQEHAVLFDTGQVSQETYQCCVTWLVLRLKRHYHPPPNWMAIVVSLLNPWYKGMDAESIFSQEITLPRGCLDSLFLYSRCW